MLPTLQMLRVMVLQSQLNCALRNFTCPFVRLSTVYSRVLVVESLPELEPLSQQLNCAYSSIPSRVCVEKYLYEVYNLKVCNCTIVSHFELQTVSYLLKR